MRKLLELSLLSLLMAAASFGQTTAINGSVTDPSGAVIPNANVTVTSTTTGFQRSTVSDAQGRYSISQLNPGSYKLSAKARGFSDFTVERVELEVESQATVQIRMEVGSTETVVSVEGAATTINTVDASLGNVINSNAIVELPSFARNVANLLSFQPGVSYFGGTDDRNGAVNGGRSDQSNITLDGADVNSQSDRQAFTSILRVTPDSVEEFRTTTTNGGADTGRGSGAEITLVTKSGTNQIHGSAYEYRRGNETAANTFFNNRIGVPKPVLLINLFGGSVGGPVKKNKAFFFVNYEGRRDASATSISRNIPTEALKQGIVTFHDAAGNLTSLGPAQMKAQVDPSGIGVNQAALSLLQKYPVGNNTLLGDGLNFTGYTFTAPVHAKQDTYTAKLDYKIDNDGRESLFWRGTLQNDHSAGTPQFPGQPPNSTTLANNKGMATGLTSVLKSNLVSTFRYGFTRQGGETTGIRSSDVVTFRNIDPIVGTNTAIKRTIPVHTFSEDMSWTHGAHDVKFGGIGRLISNQPVDYSKAFNSATTNASVIKGSGNDLIPSGLSLKSGDVTSYEYATLAVLGILTSATMNYNNTVDGTIIPTGSPIVRNFASRELELYAQDSWRLKSNLTLTYGLRFSVMPPVHEANGQQLSSSIPIGQWLDTRGALAAQGLSDQAAGVISYAPGGRPYYPQHNNWQPRLGIAYVPKGSSGISRFLFGEGKTSIRAGAGMYYDLIGQPLANFIGSNAYGLATSLSTPPNVYTSAQLPRFVSFTQIPSAPNAPLFVQAAPSPKFPVAYPNAFAITSSLDDNLKAPYTMNLNFSIGREFSHGWFVQGSYVGRLSRHNLIQRDLAMPTNLKDPKSGQTYYEAATQLQQLLDTTGLAARIRANQASITDFTTKIPFFENFWGKAAGNGLSATQVIAQNYIYNDNQGDMSSLQSDIDNGQSCNANGLSTFSSKGIVNGVGCNSVLGPYSMWSSQYSALDAWSSLGSGEYHGMQWTVQKRLNTGLTLGLNYTLSKSIDVGGRSEATSSFGSDFTINAWNVQQMREVSRYDTLHQANAYFIWQLPFGRGKRFGSTMNRALDAIVGGWELSGTWRQTSGLPVSPSNGSRWVTNWELSGYATPNGNPLPAITNNKNAPAVSGPGGPNLWSNPTAALAGYLVTGTYAGQTGGRNQLRGDGFFNIDGGLYKNFTMPWSERQKLQFRAEAFNLTNTVKFDPTSANLSLTSTSKWGQLSSQLGTPRVMEMALRFQF
jgi:hypothetical protein